MANHIDFEAKSDRELLVLVLQQTNNISELMIPDVKSRLTNIETECKRRAENCPAVTGKVINNQRFLAIGAGAGGGGILIIWGILKIVLGYFGMTI